MASMIIVMISTSSLAVDQPRQTPRLTIRSGSFGRLISRQDGIPSFILQSVWVFVCRPHLLLAVISQLVRRYDGRSHWKPFDVWAVVSLGWMLSSLVIVQSDPLVFGKDLDMGVKAFDHIYPELDISHVPS
jgi:hypothetical protein